MKLGADRLIKAQVRSMCAYAPLAVMKATGLSKHYLREIAQGKKPVRAALLKKLGYKPHVMWERSATHRRLLNCVHMHRHRKNKDRQ